MFARDVNSFATEFERWPMPNDPRYLRIDEHRPAGYFSCEELAVPEAGEGVKQGVERAVEAWKEWDEENLGDTRRLELILPPGMNLSDSGIQRRQPGADDEGGVEETKESGEPPRDSGPDGVGSGDRFQEEMEDDARDAAVGSDADEHDPGKPGGRRAGKKKRKKIVGPDEATLLRILEPVPNFKHMKEDLQSRLASSTLRLTRWKRRLETTGHGMRDFKRVPHIRPNINVVAPLKEVITSDEAGPHGVRDDEPLLVVTIFGRRNFTLFKNQEYTILARNTLGDLHRVMYCSLGTLLGQQSQEGVLHPDILRPSISFFFIEGKFYVSHREEQQPDHIESLLQWIDESGKNRRKCLGLQPDAPLEVHAMENTVLGDLKLRLGTRYLYSHLGDCEHHFAVTDMRLPHERDHRASEDYPMLTFQKHYRKRRCCVCDARPAKYCVIGDPLGDDHKTVYCEFCHFLLHYDQDGNLLHDDFEVWPYLHED